jgi:hypothetical protein
LKSKSIWRRARFALSLLEEKGDWMLYMVIERFRNHDAATAVYRRFREHGRMLPDGLKYIESWTETTFDRCFQLMECEDPHLFQGWMSRWQDLVEFEIVPVVSSREAADAIKHAL